MKKLNLSTSSAIHHPKKKEPDSRQVRRQKERLAKKMSLVDPKRLGRER